jgi:hypothetical protein
VSLLRKIISSFGSSETAEGQRECDALIEAFLKEHPTPESWSGVPDPRKSTKGIEILAMDREQQAVIVGALIPRLAEFDKKADAFRAKLPEGMRRWNVHREPGWFTIWFPRMALHHLLETLMARKLPLGAARVTAMANWCASAQSFALSLYPIVKLASAAEDLAGSGPLDTPTINALNSI